MSVLTTAAQQGAPRTDARAPAAKAILADLMSLPPVMRRDIYRDLDRRDIRVLLATAHAEMGTPYGIWQDDPEGFITDVIGESLWSKPREIMQSVVDHTKTAVPSCFSSSKTHSSSRLVLWWSNVHPVGTARVVTVAPRWRQVIGLIWPEVRRAHRRAGLPGQVDMAQLKMKTRDGLDYVVADGLSASPTNEDAVQGIHAPHVLVIVDEAGGIGHLIGKNLAALLTGDHTRLLAIGNPPAGDPGSWFESFCDSDSVNVIRISAYSTPNFTGEKVGRCRSCPPEAAAHLMSKHLVNQDNVAEAVADHGADSTYITAKVKAQFPKGGGDRAMPSSWVEAAVDSDDPVGEDYVRLCDLGLPDETAEHLVEMGAWVRLGVDIAADGGDEFVIGREVGDLGTIEHYSSGEDNANPVHVAGKILAHIRRAQALAAALGSEAKVRVKVDANGLGWGVVGTLEAWGSEGMHDAEIVGVMVSEATNRDPDGSTMVPARKRDELWLAGRELVQPDPVTNVGRWRLRVEKRTAAQLSGPKYTTTSGGLTTIESKKAMKARGLRSPDRAEALLLAVYEPAPPKSKRKKARVLGEL